MALRLRALQQDCARRKNQHDGRRSSVQAQIQARKFTDSPGRFVSDFPDLMRMIDPVDDADPNASGEMEFWGRIETVPLTPQMADFLQVPIQSGVLVLNVHFRMPCSRAGVQAGDIILSVDGRRVDSPRTFFSYLTAHSQPRQSCTVSIRSTPSWDVAGRPAQAPCRCARLRFHTCLP